MIQLTLVRHATAEPGVPDRERRLSGRGRREAPGMARRALRAGARPETILTSTALRATETAAVFAEVIGAPVVEREELYGAAPAALLAAARGTSANEVMVVAHDPGLSDLATELAGRDVRMAPCNVAIFTWQGADWDAVGALPPDDIAFLAE